MPERPRHGEQPPELSKPEAVVGIRLETLRPDVREYAQNLETQIRELYGKRETLDAVELKRLSALSKQLREITEQGDLSAEMYEERAVRLLENAKAEARIMSHDKSDFANGAFVEIASAEADMDRLDEANETVKQITGEESPTEIASVYRHIIEADIRAGRNPKASLETTVRWLKRIENFSNLVPQLDRLAEVFVSAGDFDGAKAMWRSFGTVLGNGTLGHRLALLEARAGRFDDAKRTISAITDPGTRADALRVLAVAEAKAGHDPTATFRSAITEVKSIGGHGRMANEYVNIALAQVEAGQTPLKSINMAKSIVGEITNPTDKGELFSRIALAEAKAGRDPSLSFTRAKDIANQAGFGNQRGIVYRRIGSDQVKAARFEDAKKTALEIVNDDSECIYAYTAIIRELLEAERTEDALELLKANEHINELDHVRLYSEVVDVQVRKGENPDGTLAIAREIAEKIWFSLTRESAFGTLALASVRANRYSVPLFAKASRALDEMPESGLLNQGFAMLTSIKIKIAVAYHQRAKERAKQKHAE